MLIKVSSYHDGDDATEFFHVDTHSIPRSWAIPDNSADARSLVWSLLGVNSTPLESATKDSLESGAKDSHHTLDFCDEDGIGWHLSYDVTVITNRGMAELANVHVYRACAYDIDADRRDPEDADRRDPEVVRLGRTMAANDLLTALEREANCWWGAEEDARDNGHSRMALHINQSFADQLDTWQAAFRAIGHELTFDIDWDDECEHVSAVLIEGDVGARLVRPLKASWADR
jgi:hypothetical protein